MFGSSKPKHRSVRRKTNIRPRIDELEPRVVLSTFKVNTTLDTVAVSLKTGKDASGHISLRSAIEAANAKPNADTIILPAGTFTLTIPGAGENNDATGDLDIRGNVTIKGKGAGQTIVDGNNLDRVFAIFSGKVSLSGMTIQHGHALVAGGGILNSGGKVSLTSVDLENNVAVGINGGAGVNGLGGGAVGNPGGAGVEGTVAEGGAIMNGAGTLTMKNCFISTNQASGGSGGNGGNGAFGGGAAAKRSQRATRDRRQRWCRRCWRASLGRWCLQRDRRKAHADQRPFLPEFRPRRQRWHRWLG